MVPPERIELSLLASEASTLSTELQGRSEIRIPRTALAYKAPSVDKPPGG